MLGYARHWREDHSDEVAAVRYAGLVPPPYVGRTQGLLRVGVQVPGCRSPPAKWVALKTLKSSHVAARGATYNGIDALLCVCDARYMPTHQELAVRLARAGVARTAPAELDLFDETAAAFFATRGGARVAARRDEPLGMGLETVEILVSGAALAAAVEVVKHLSVKAVDAVSGRAWLWLRRLFRRGDTPARAAAVEAPMLVMHSEEFTRLRVIAKQRAELFGLDADRAGLLAEAILGALASQDPSAFTEE